MEVYILSGIVVVATMIGTISRPGDLPTCTGRQVHRSRLWYIARLYHVVSWHGHLSGHTCNNMTVLWNPLHFDSSCSFIQWLLQDPIRELDSLYYLRAKAVSPLTGLPWYILSSSITFSSFAVILSHIPFNHGQAPGILGSFSSTGLDSFPTALWHAMQHLGRIDRPWCSYWEVLLRPLRSPYLFNSSSSSEESPSSGTGTCSLKNLLSNLNMSRTIVRILNGIKAMITMVNPFNSLLVVRDLVLFVRRMLALLLYHWRSLEWCFAVLKG